VKGDHVGACRELRQRNQFGSACDIRIVRDHVHAERAGQASHLAPDGAEADHPEAGAVEVETHHSVAPGPAAVVDHEVELAQALGRGQDQGERALRDRAAADAGRVDDRHAQPGGGLHVDVVVPRSGAGHRAQPRSPREQHRIEAGAAHDQDLGGG
jgi:hypothetical protein